MSRYTTKVMEPEKVATLDEVQAKEDEVQSAFARAAECIMRLVESCKRVEKEGK